LGDPEFRLLRDLVYREAGIHLAESKRALVAGRLARRLRELGLASFRDYCRYLQEGGPAETQEMLNRVCTNETRFFREPRQFAYIEERLLDEWARSAAAGRRPRSIRAWSAACSTGEEPYSLAMTLLDRFPPGSGWRVDVLATDLSTAALRRAEAALWPIEKAADIEERHLKAFMLCGTGPQQGRMKAGPLLRSVVRFAPFNLNAQPFTPGGPFDLVLCRNVLIYFDRATRTRVLPQLMAQVAPGGALLLGHAESMAGLPGAARPVAPGIYRAAEKAAGAGGGS